MTIKNVKRVFHVVHDWLSHNVENGGIENYPRIIEALEVLAELVINTEDDDGSMWYIGDTGSFCLQDLIIGAYWHCTEWHNGQDSDVYALQSLLGDIYQPNFDTPDLDNDAYIFLNEIAEKWRF